MKQSFLDEIRPVIEKAVKKRTNKNDNLFATKICNVISALLIDQMFRGIGDCDINMAEEAILLDADVNYKIIDDRKILKLAECELNDNLLEYPLKNMKLENEPGWIALNAASGFFERNNRPPEEEKIIKMLLNHPKINLNLVGENGTPIDYVNEIKNSKLTSLFRNKIYQDVNNALNDYLISDLISLVCKYII